MILSDLHVHTVFSDGRHTVEQMVCAAIERGMQRIGFSDHAYTDFDESYCVKKEDIGVYRDTIAGLKRKYADKIEILCGIEQDFYSGESTDGYDYAIGSLHYVKSGDAYISVDHKEEILLDAAEQYFDGDIYSLLEEYYRTLALFAQRKDIHIIGHFDLVTKFNEGGKLFDEAHPRYVAAWQAAADQLLTMEIPFEVNTGAIARGYRTAPYPAKPIVDYIHARGGRLLLSSDAHAAENLCFAFEDWAAFTQ